MCHEQGAAQRRQPASRPAVGQTTHWLMFAVDIASYSRRAPDIQQRLRRALYQIVQDSCDASDIPWDSCYHEDRGDAIIVFAPAGTSVEAVINRLVINLQANLRAHNKTSIAEAQIHLRVAVHAGWLSADAQGISGDPINHLFRILEAPVLKSELASHGGEFALIVSAGLYDDVLQYSPAPIAPDSLRPVTVDVKETQAHGWLWLPPTGPSSPPARRVNHPMRRDPRSAVAPRPLIKHIRRSGDSYGETGP